MCFPVHSQLFDLTGLRVDSSVATVTQVRSFFSQGSDGGATLRIAPTKRDHFAGLCGAMGKLRIISRKKVMSPTLMRLKAGSVKCISQCYWFRRLVLTRSL